jgi:nucleotide-binding universal stress UspA family protein
MPENLVVGIDGSDESATALRWAMEEAAKRELAVQLIYGLAIPVVSDAYGMVMTRPDIDELAEYSQKLLEAAETAARRCDPDVPVTSRLVNGPPAAVLLEASKRARGLVLGSRGLGAISGRMLGSVSVRVSAKACCPVYIIPSNFDSSTVVGDPVVVGVDGSPHGDAALALALDEARCRDVVLRVVTAYHVPWLARPIEPGLIEEFQSSEEALAQRIAEDALARMRTDRHAGVEVEIVLRQGASTEVLIAAGKDAALTCVGSRGRTALSRALLGSVSRAVLQDATRPVAVVHEPRGDR